MSDFSILLVPTDFSDHAQVAKATALALAKRLGAELHLVHVLQTPTLAYPELGGSAHVSADYMLAVRESAQKALEAAAETMPLDVKVHLVEGTMVAGPISELAEQIGADLIVMGTHGRTGLAHAFLGSVAERTLRQAPCPVMTVRDPEAE